MASAPEFGAKSVELQAYQPHDAVGMGDKSVQLVLCAQIHLDETGRGRARPPPGFPARAYRVSPARQCRGNGAGCIEQPVDLRIAVAAVVQRPLQASIL